MLTVLLFALFALIAVAAAAVFFVGKASKYFQVMFEGGKPEARQLWVGVAVLIAVVLGLVIIALVLADGSYPTLYRQPGHR